jgi:GT2 family glycosyltransferase
VGQTLPFFSIIIPTCDRPEQLAECLHCLTCLDYPRDRFEVMVVDDGSSMSLETVIAPFGGQLDVTLLRQSHAGPAIARNTGAARARGQYLAFTDDDCRPDSRWLRALARRCELTPERIIGGRTLNALTGNIYSTASQLLVDHLYAYYNSDPDRARFFTSNNWAMSADCFREVGGFDAGFFLAAGEDRELCDRWLHDGRAMSYAPEARVNHAHVLTLRAFWRQHFTYGRGAFRFHQTRARRRSARFWIEPLAFYLRLLRSAISPSRPWRSLALVALLLLSQIANATGLLWEMARIRKD